MTIKNRVHSIVKSPLFWRVGLWGLASFCLIMAGVVWMSGTDETRDALENGRRLIIRLDTGAVEGKQISLESPSESPESAAPESPPKPPVESPIKSPAESPIESPIKSPESSPASPASPESTPESTPQSTPPLPPAPEATSPTPESSPVAAAAPAPIVADLSTIKPATVPLADINEALLERTTVGALPMIGPKGLKPWRHYSKPYRHKGNLPTIAILVTGLGQNKLVSDGAIKLPENVSLSFSPYARDLASWAHAARIAGHEIMIDLPLEPSNFPASDPGPYGLLVGKGAQENATRLQWLMSRIPGYVGFVTPPNEVFSANDAAFKALLELLSSRGLMIAIEHEPARNETKLVLDTSTTPYTIGDVRLDEELSASAIQARLSTLEKLASKRGYAVGVAQAFPLTIQQLNLWAAELEKNGYTLVPVTFITNLKFSS